MALGNTVTIASSLVNDLINFLNDGFVIVDLQTGTYFKFDTFFNNSYTKQTNVPSQPLEMGAFAVDSKQISPNVINVTASKAISIFNYLTGQDIPSLKKNLETLANSPNLLAILINSKFSEYSETYSNYTLNHVYWENNPKQLHLVAQLQFTEVRLVNVSFTDMQNTASATDAQTQQNGIVQPVAPQTSVIQDISNRVQRYFQ